MRREELLPAVQAAPTPEEALSTLDALAASGADREELAALYDMVAGRLADAGRFADAVTAERRALEHGFDGVPDGRQMLAWYLLKAGETEAGAALWDELLADGPDDPDVVLTAGVAFHDAGQLERAAGLLARALELMLAGTMDGNAVREAADERAEILAALGRPAEPIDDQAAEAVRRMDRQADGLPIAVPWYPAAEYAAALQRLPAFAEDWEGHDHAAYSRELDVRVRDVTAAHGHAPRIVPVAVAPFLDFAGRTGLDPAWAEARARYADEHRDEALAWPPGRNDPCWCGADAKYKRHCGA